MNGKKICTAATFSLFSISSAFAEELQDGSQSNVPEFDVSRLDYFQGGDMGFEGGAGELTVSSVSLGAILSKPLVLFEDLTIFPFLSYKYTSLDFDNTLPGFPIGDEDLHSVSLMTIGLKSFQNSNWFAAGFTRAELATDFGSVDSDSITFDVAGGVGYRFNDRFTLGFGIVATDLNNEANVIPGINFSWKINDSLQVGLYGPNFFATYSVSDSWKISILGQNGGGTWNFDDQFGQTRTVDTNSFNIGIFTQNKIVDNLWIRAGIGFSLGNEIEIRDVSGASSFTQELDGAPFAQISISLTKW